MSKLIEAEWIKFRQNRKNRFLFLSLILYIICLVVYLNIQYDSYFPSMVKVMREEKSKAKGMLNMIELYKKHDENYKINPQETEYLNTEVKKSTLLEYYYKSEEIGDWRYILQIQNEKYSNLIQGEEKGFVERDVLDARGQNPLVLSAAIINNQYLIENDVLPYVNPYELNGANFLVLLLRGYTPVILAVFFVLLSVDIFLGEMEEGSYKLYFTQPYSRKKIFWSKMLSIYIFSIGLLLALILLSYFIISIFYGFGDLSYPQVIGSSKTMFSLIGNHNNLGEFQIISTIKYIILSYLLLFIMIILFVTSIVALSMLCKYTSITLGAFTCVIMLGYVSDIFLESMSLLRFYLPLSYIKIAQALSGQMNTSYIMGIITALVSIILMMIFVHNLFINKDLVGGNI